MCLSYDEKMTNDYKNNKKPIVAYKLVMIERKQMITPYQKREVAFGINKSDRGSTEVRAREKTEGINYGCHLFLTKKGANEDIKDWKTAYENNDDYEKMKFKILKVKVNPKDVIAAGTFVYISQNGNQTSIPSIACIKYRASLKDNN